MLPKPYNIGREAWPEHMKMNQQLHQVKRWIIGVDLASSEKKYNRPGPFDPRFGVTDHHSE